MILGRFFWCPTGYFISQKFLFKYFWHWRSYLLKGLTYKTWKWCKYNILRCILVLVSFQFVRERMHIEELLRCNSGSAGTIAPHKFLYDDFVWWGCNQAFPRKNVRVCICRILPLWSCAVHDCVSIMHS